MTKKILICDDDKGILEMLEMLLEGDEYIVSTEQDSLKIFDRLKESTPDLLILDLWMPVLSGDQITSRLRNTTQYAQLPILVMSASRDGSEIAKKVGATSYLSKPFDIEDMSAKIKRMTFSSTNA